MTEYQKQEIMGQSRHQFIYGYDSEERTQFLKSLVDDYPIKMDENSPMAIYMDEFALPNIEIKNENIDKIRLCTISREYLNFSIAYNIMDQLRKQVDIEKINNRNEEFLDFINRILMRRSNSKITSYDEFCKILNESRNFYSKYYQQYILDDVKNMDIDSLKIQFLVLDMLINHLKEMLNNNSYFGIIIDSKNSMPMISTNAINGLIASRINRNLSMKVSCQIENWQSYYDLNGVIVEYVHDYGIVELDDNYSKHVKQIQLKHQKI